MSNPVIASSVAAAIVFAGLAAAQTPAPRAASAPMSKDGHSAAKNASGDPYSVDKGACRSLSGNARDICMSEVSGKDRVARANARQLRVEKETEARMDDNDDRRDAEYALAVERCGALAGAAKDACLGQAKLRHGKS